jgi:hypothetical protein
MVTTLFVVLVVLDVVLFGMFFMLNRKQMQQGEALQSLSDERKLLEDLRQSVQEELELADNKGRDVLSKVTRLAMEAEQEVKMGSTQLTSEMQGLSQQLGEKFEKLLEDLRSKQMFLEAMLKRIDKEKVLLHKLVARGEKIAGFFDKRVPYQEVLEEIEDKKYIDARTMLSQGMDHESVAKELGMTVTEVRIVAGLTA